MNRNYKVIWNRSLGCFTAVAEYAKSRGKSLSSAVSSSASPSSTVSAGGARLLQLSALCIGMSAAGFSMQASAACTAGATSFNCGSGSSANNSGVAIGQNAVANAASNTIAIGRNATAGADQAIAIGGADVGPDSKATTASGDQSIAIGANVISSGSSALAIGGDDLDSASQTNVDANGNFLNDNSALNGGNVNTIFKDISGRNLVDPTTAAKQYVSTESKGAGSVAIGTQAISKGALSTAFGTQTKADGIASAAFGVSARASKDGSVALGAGSSTLTDANSVTSATINGITYGNFAGSTDIVAGDQVSVGSAGRERQIKSVAAGNISDTSTDAINGSQLFSVARTLSDAQPVVYTNAAGIRVYKQANGNFTTNPDGTGTPVGNSTVRTAILAADGTITTETKLTNVAAGSIATNSTDAVNGSQLNTIAQGNKTLLGGAATVNTSGVVTSTNIGGTNETTIDGAISAANTQANKALTFTGNVLNDTDANGSQQKLGSTLNIVGGAATTAASSNANVKTVITDGKVDIQIVDAPTFTGQVKANGFDASSQKIVNVANGTIGNNSKDAINGGQISAIVTTANGKINNIGEDTASALGGTSSFNPATGEITAPTYTLNDGNNTTDTTNFRNVGGALSNLDTRTTTNTTAVNKGINFSLNNLGSRNYQLGQTIGVETGDNLTATPTATGAKFDVNPVLTNLTSATFGENADRFTINKDGVQFLNAAGTARENTPSITATGIDAGNQQITGVASGVGDDNNAANIGDLNTAIAANKVKYFSVKSTGGTNEDNKGATGTDAIAIGKDASASNTNAISIGTGSTATVQRANALGFEANATGVSSIALGARSQAIALDSLAIGTTATSRGTRSQAVGSNASAIGVESAAIGTNASASARGGLALGSNSVANVAGNIAGFVPTSASSADQVTITNTNSTDTNLGAISVGTGAIGGNRQIVNVAAGTKNSDAVNVAQLTAVDNQVFTNTADIGKGIKFSLNGGEKTYALGQTIGVETGANLTATPTATGAKFDVNPVLTNLTSATFGENADRFTINKDGVQFVDATGTARENTPSFTAAGISAGNQKITDVTAGTETKDAVNFGQLQAVSDSVAAIDFPIRSSNAKPFTTVATGTNALAVGSNAQANGDNSTAVGENTTAAAGSVAVGESARATGTNSVIIGRRAGDGSDPSNSRNVAVGDSAGTSVRGNNNAAFGSNAGSGVTASGNTAIGDSSGQAVTGAFNTALGRASGQNVSGENNIAIGNTAGKGTTASNTIAIGLESKANAQGAIATGQNAKASADYAIATGQRAEATGIRSTAIGRDTRARAADSIAIGTNANITNESYRGGVAIGRNTQVNAVNSVALGLESVANAQTGTSFLTNVAANTNNGTVSVGSNTATRRITNVADGSAASDAATVAQLTEQNRLTNVQGVDTAKNLGGGAVYNAATGNISAPTFNVRNSTNTPQTTVADAIDALNQGFKLESNGANTTNIQPSETVDIGTATGETNIKVAKSGNVIDFSLDRDIKVDSVTVGNTANNTKLTTDARGLSVNQSKIVDVLDGNVDASSQQAINGRQLFNAVNGVTDLGLNFSGDTGAVINRKLGQQLNIKGGATGTLTTGNIGVTNDGNNGLSVQLANNIDLGANGSVKLGNVLLNTDARGLSVNQAKIVDIADGDVTSTSQQAINGRQLFKQGQGVASIIGGTTTYNPATGTFTNTNIGGTNKDNINDAIASVGQAATAAKTTVTEGKNITVTPTVDALTGATSYEVKTKDDLVLDSLTTGNTVTNKAGVTVDDKSGNVTSVVATGTNVVDGKGNTANYIATGSSITDGNGNSNNTLATGNTVNDGKGNVANYVATGVNITDGTNTTDYGATGMVAGNGTDGKSTIVNQDGVSFTDSTGTATGPTITAGGIDAGDTVISGVKDGVLDSDATNVGQLNDVAATAGRGFDITTSSTGTGTVSGTSVSNVAPGSLQTITAGNNISIAQSGINLTIATNPELIADSLTTGNTVTNNAGVTVDDKSGNVTSVVATGTNVVDGKGNTANYIATGSSITDGNGNSNNTLATGNTVNDGKGNVANYVATGVNITDGTNTTDYGANGLTIAGGPSVTKNGINAGNTVITGVTAGAVNSTSTDAVNGSQLNATNNNVTMNTNAINSNTNNIANNTNAINRGINFGDGTTANNYALGNTISVTGDSNVNTTTVAGGVQVGLNKDIDLGATGSVTTGNTTVNNNGVTIKDGPSLTATGINAGGQVVSGVADGIKVNDAVNVGQLNNFGNQVNGAINDLGYRIDDVADDANAGISAAMAMSSIPQSFIPGKSMIGGGIATYNGEGAVAVGLSRVSDNGRWVIKANGTADTKGNAGGAVGAGFHF